MPWSNSVSVDQTTDGTTNKVYIGNNPVLGAGTNTIGEIIMPYVLQSVVNLTSNASATLTDDACQSVRVQVTGTYVGTLNFEISDDGGTTWNATAAKIGLPMGFQQLFTKSITNVGGIYIISTNGAQNSRVRMSGYVSGTAAVVMTGTGYRAHDEVDTEINGQVDTSHLNNMLVAEKEVVWSLGGDVSIFGSASFDTRYEIQTGVAGGLSAASAAVSAMVVGVALGSTDSSTLETLFKVRMLPNQVTESAVTALFNWGPAINLNSTARMGADDGNSGYYFYYDTSGTLGTASRLNSVETKVTQANWNVDKLDGTGPSGAKFTLEPLVSCQYIVRFYGDQSSIVEYGMIIGAQIDATGAIVNQNPGWAGRYIPVHRFSGGNSANMRSVVIPIKMSMANNSAGTGGAANNYLYIQHRSFSCYGAYRPPWHENSQPLTAKALANSASTYTPLWAWRKRSATPGPWHCFLKEIMLLPTQDMQIMIVIGNVTLTGASWTFPSSGSLLLSSTEVDIAATAISGSYESLYQCVVPGGAAGTTRYSTLADLKNAINYVMSRDATFFMVVLGRLITAAASQTVSGNCTIIEEY